MTGLSSSTLQKACTYSLWSLHVMGAKTRNQNPLSAPPPRPPRLFLTLQSQLTHRGVIW